MEQSEQLRQLEQWLEQAKDPLLRDMLTAFFKYIHKFK